MLKKYETLKSKFQFNFFCMIKLECFSKNIYLYTSINELLFPTEPASESDLIGISCMSSTGIC